MRFSVVDCFLRFVWIGCGIRAYHEKIKRVIHVHTQFIIYSFTTRMSKRETGREVTFVVSVTYEGFFLRRRRRTGDTQLTFCMIAVPHKETIHPTTTRHHFRTTVLLNVVVQDACMFGLRATPPRGPAVGPAPMPAELAGRVGTSLVCC